MALSLSIFTRAQTESGIRFQIQGVYGFESVGTWGPKPQIGTSLYLNSYRKDAGARVWDMQAGVYTSKYFEVMPKYLSYEAGVTVSAWMPIEKLFKIEINRVAAKLLTGIHVGFYYIYDGGSNNPRSITGILDWYPYETKTKYIKLRGARDLQHANSFGSICLGINL